MTSRPAVPPGEGDGVTEAARKKGLKSTSWGLAGVFAILWFATIATGFVNGSAYGICQLYAACNETLVAIGVALAPIGLWVIFVVCVVVSVVILRQGRRAYLVPIVGAIAIVGCAVLSVPIASAGVR